MSRKKKAAAAESPAPPRAPAPSVGNPGNADTLPPEVTGVDKAGGALDKVNEKDAIQLLETIRRELGTTGATATLRRRNPSFGIPTMASLGMSVDAKDVTQEFLARTFGGGDFEIRFRGPGMNFDRTVTISIDPTIPPKNPLADQAANNRSQQAPAFDVPALVTAIKNAIPQKDDSGLVEIVKAALAKPERTDETKMLLDVIREMRDESRKSEDRMMKLIEKMSERNAPVPVKSFAEQLEEITSVADAIGLGRRGKEEFAWGPVIEKGLDAAGKLIEARLAGGAPEIRRVSPIARAAPPPVVAPPAHFSPPTAVNGAEPTTPAVNGAAPEPSTEDPAMLQFALNRFRSSAIEAAKKGKDAYPWTLTTIAYVEENFPNFLSAIFETANAPDWFDRIFGANPEARQHFKFLEEVRETVLLRAFFLHARLHSEEKATPADTAALFLRWINKDFLDALESVTDAESWTDFFEESEIPSAWLAQFRDELRKHLAPTIVPVPPVPAEKK